MRPVVAGFLLALTFTAGCGNGGALEPVNLAGLRVYNASPDSPPAVDIFWRGGLVRQNLPYANGQLTQLVQPGSGTIEVQNTTTGDVLLDYNASLAAGSAYTFAFTGLTGSLQAVFVKDDTSAAPSGKFKARILHLAPLGPAMDLYVTPTADISAASPVITGTAYTKASSYAAVPIGTVRLQLTQTGTKTVLWDSGNTLTLSSGMSITLFVIGKAGPASIGGGGAPYTAQLVADHQ